MTNSYRIAILSDESSETIIEAIVQLTGTSARITMIRAGSAIEEGVPKQINDVDLSILVRAASTLSVAPVLTGPSTGVEAPDLRGDLPDIETADQPAAPSISPIRDFSAEEIKTTQAQILHPEPGNSRARTIPADFGVTYWRLGSIVKVSKHYDVPHHTAAEWIKTLQTQGKVSSPWPKKGTRPLRK